MTARNQSLEQCYGFLKVRVALRQDNLSSINDSKDSGRSSDDGADDSAVTEQCREEDSGSVFTAVEAYDSSSAEDIGPYWNTLEWTPYYEPIE